MSEAAVTTSTMLFNHLFEACNILRGPINQDEYKTYVIPILFFKRISDIYDEETAHAMYSVLCSSPRLYRTIRILNDPTLLKHEANLKQRNTI